MLVTEPGKEIKRPGGLWARRLLVFIAFALCISAHAGSVRVLVSGEQAYYRETQQAFTATLLSLAPETTISVTVLGDNPEQHTQHPSWPEDVLVTIGTPATKLVHQHHLSQKTIALFITSDVWREISADHSYPDFHSAIALDQSPDRIMLLARLLAPHARKAATVTGEISSTRTDALQESATRLNFSLATQTLGTKDNPVARMSPLFKNNDIFVALPDRAVFNRATAKWILYLGFRSKVPVIGFSKAYTDAGALASIYASPGNIGRHGAELTARTLLDPDSFVSRLHSPRYYTLHSNSSVARALDIDLPNESTLYDMYEEALARLP